MKNIIIAIFLIFISSCTVNREEKIDAYNKGLNNGRAAGYHQGFEKGKEEGYKMGRDSGAIAGRTLGLHEGYNKGYNEGYNKGIIDGEYNAKQASFKDKKKKKFTPNLIFKICKFIIIPVFAFLILGIVLLLIFNGRGHTYDNISDRTKGIFLRAMSAVLPFLVYAILTSVMSDGSLEIYDFLNEDIVFSYVSFGVAGFAIPFVVFQFIRSKKHAATNFLIVFYTLFLVIFCQIYFDNKYNSENIFFNMCFIVGIIVYFIIFQNPKEFVKDMWITSGEETDRDYITSKHNSSGFVIRTKLPKKAK